MALLKTSSIPIVVAFMALAMLQASLAQDSPQDFLDPQIKYRAEVGVQPLVWNNTVAVYAVAYAKKRAVDCNLEHSQGPYGENIAEGSGEFTTVDGVNLWVGEKLFCDYQSNSCLGGQQCGHYTQVVWRNSLYLGCARAKCLSSWWFVTCNYDPPGNYIGERPY